MKHLYLVLCFFCLRMNAQDHFQVKYPSFNFSAEIQRGFKHYSKEEGYIPSGSFMNQTIPLSAGFIFPIAENRSKGPTSERNALLYFGYTPSMQNFNMNGYTITHQAWSGLLSLHCFDLLSQSDPIDLLLSSGFFFGKNYLRISDGNATGKYSNGFFDLSSQVAFRVCLFKKVALNLFARYSIDLSRPTYRHQSGETYYISKYKHTGMGLGAEIGFVL